MSTYIALLRGINVSGKNKIKMVELKQLFLNLGFCNVVTYIQSGNVLFSTKKISTVKIEELIINEIKKHFNYSIKVLILKKNEFEAVYKANPLLNNISFDLKKVCVVFLNKTPSKEGIKNVKSLASKDEIVIFKDRTAYLYCPKGFGSTKLSNNNIEAKLNVSATSRNWNTVTKLVELSNQ